MRSLQCTAHGVQCAGFRASCRVQRVQSAEGDFYSEQCTTGVTVRGHGRAGQGQDHREVTLIHPDRGDVVLHLPHPSPPPSQGSPGRGERRVMLATIVQQFSVQKEVKRDVGGALVEPGAGRELGVGEYQEMEVVHLFPPFCGMGSLGQGWTPQAPAGLRCRPTECLDEELEAGLQVHTPTLIKTEYWDQAGGEGT